MRDPRLRADALVGLSELLFTTRMNIRMAKDLKATSAGQAAQLTIRIEDLQKQLTGWLTWTKSKIPVAARSAADTSPTRPGPSACN